MKSMLNPIEQKIEVSEKGIFRVDKKEMTPKQIVNSRRLIQNKITYTQTNIIEHTEDIERCKERIVQLEKQLGELTNPIVDAYIQDYNRKMNETTTKAQKFLRDFVGEDLYSQLQEHHHIDITGNDGESYRLDNKGRLYRKDTANDWTRLCIIRPSKLPLPAFIAALFVTTPSPGSTFTPLVRR